jgi:DNA invertase Pin-like site-specific DNA recombinase
MSRASRKHQPTVSEQLHRLLGEAWPFPGRPPFDVVVVHSFSRFFRDHFELEFYVRKLAKNGVKLVSITQDMGDDPMHVMMRQIMTVRRVPVQGERQACSSRPEGECASAKSNAWDHPFYEYEKSRFLEFTSEDIAAAYRFLTPSHIETLKTYPCLFAYEGEFSPVRIGHLTNSGPWQKLAH